MNGCLRVRWTLVPARAPMLLRHCAGCKTVRPFASSGKVRLNANGRRLDAWLIYLCTRCERSWLRPLMERVPVSAVPPDDHDAMERSRPDWVRTHEHDLTALARHTDRILESEDVPVVKPEPSRPVGEPAAIVLTLEAAVPTGLRLDRLLARELGLSRSRLTALACSGGMETGGQARQALRRRIGHGVTVTLHGQALTAAEMAAVTAALQEG